MEFTQNYSPIGNVYVSLIFAAIPIVVLFVMLGASRIAAHWLLPRPSFRRSSSRSSSTVCRRYSRSRLPPSEQYSDCGN
jgi:hypothetical protein